MPDPEGHPLPLDPDLALLQRGRVLDGLAGSAWHELAQPLGGLRSFVSLLQSEGWSSEHLGVDPVLISDATITLERLARTLTDLARGSSRAVRLDALVDDLVALAGHLLMDVEVVNAIPGDAPDLAVDPATLRLVLASLLVDSVRALGGPRSARGRLRWDATVRGETVVLRIEDSAPAAAPADLAVVRSLLEARGGTVVHAPARATGNLYTLTLPVLDAADIGDAADPRDGADPRDAQHSDDAADRAGRLTILVCDDEATVRGLLARIVERDGHRVLEAGSGPEALAHLDRTVVDVVITDHHMAGMTGLELHAAAVGRRPALRRRFVFMSGDAQDAELVAFARTNGLLVLGKPFDIRTLPALIRDVAQR